MPRSISLLLLLFLPLLSVSKYHSARPGGKDYALFFAVETYENKSAWKDLPGLIDECEAIRKDLIERYGFSSESKVVHNPTLNDIAAELARWRSREYGPDDQLLIFFSGHGQFLDDVQEGFFIPSNGKSKDADFISRNWYSLLTLPRHVTTIKCRHILLAIDACYSGTIDSQVALKDENEEWAQPENNGDAQFHQYVHDLLANKSRLLMTSGGKTRTKHPSDFVRWFREALATLGGKDRLLRPADIEERWPASTISRPLSGTFEGHEAGGNFLFVYQPKAAPVKASSAPDYDEDGTPDATDKCPTEAGPAATKGCPDQDGDGVADKFDRCKTEKGPVSNDGCPVSTEPKPVAPTTTRGEKTFRILLLEWPSHLDINVGKFALLSDVKEEVIDGKYYYFTGQYSNLRDADAMLLEIKNMGFKTAKVVDSKIFQILLLSWPSRLDMKSGQLSLLSNVREDLVDGKYNYYIGPYLDKTEADAVLPHLLNLGFKNAKVVHE